ncbi:hypothetical protein F5Y05DRAFT_342663 [Hypoxylon sp. FL0543]|nr:hypothetical protein F5Y05DRAFT_342663 [Hypoxylon sp. FL0543]
MSGSGLVGRRMESSRAGLSPLKGRDDGRLRASGKAYLNCLDGIVHGTVLSVPEGARGGGSKRNLEARLIRFLWSPSYLGGHGRRSQPIVRPIVASRSDLAVEIQRSTNPDPSSGAKLQYSNLMGLWHNSSWYFPVKKFPEFPV